MAAKVFRINGFDAKKKALVAKICEHGGVVVLNNPVEIKIADFDGRLHGELVPKTVHIRCMVGIAPTTLKLQPVEELELGLMTSDLYDGNDMVKLADAIK